MLIQIFDTVQMALSRFWLVNPSTEKASHLDILAAGWASIMFYSGSDLSNYTTNFPLTHIWFNKDNSCITH